MSRRCPKRNHLFLNWLKTNRFRFAFSPYIKNCRKRQIDFGFYGITKTIRFCMEYTSSGGPWITVDVISEDRKMEGLMRFYGAEVLTSDGWVSLAARDEYRRYFATKEELWIEWCFERFLKWFNSTLHSEGVAEFSN